MAGWAPAVSCLSASACLAILSCPALASVRFTWSEALIWATAYVLLVFFISVATGWTVRFIISPGGTVPVGEGVLWIAAGGLWLIPAIIFAVKGSVLSFAVAAFCGLGIARAFRGFEYEFVQPDASDVPSTQRILTFTAAVLMHAAFFAAVASARVASAALLMSACFLVGWYAYRTNPLSRRRIITTVLMAIGVTACALNPKIAFLPSHAGGGDGPSKAQANDDLYSGFILLAERKRTIHLVAPMASRRSNSFGARPTSLLSIPFSGKYYVFYWPMRHAPKSSFVTKGTPIEYNFTSQDRAPLRMEALQTLEEQIDLQCCSRIDLSIRSTDALPGSIGLELILANTETPKGPVQSLGRRQLTLANPELEALPVSETLRFEVPPVPLIRGFNEIRVVFHLAQFRMNRGANIAIELFDLVPSGSR